MRPSAQLLAENKLRCAGNLALPEAPPFDVAAGDGNGCGGGCRELAAVTELQLSVLDGAAKALPL